MAFTDEFIKSAAAAERNLQPIPSPASVAASKQVASTAAQKLPEENISASYGNLGVKPSPSQVGVNTPKANPPTNRGGIVSPKTTMTVAEGIKAKYGFDPSAYAEAVKDRTKYVAGELGKYGEAFSDKASEYASAGKQAAAETLGTLKQGVQKGGARGLMRAAAGEGTKAIGTLGGYVLPTAKDVGEFVQSVPSVTLGGEDQPVVAKAAPAVAEKSITQTEKAPVTQPAATVEQPKPAVSTEPQAPSFTKEEIEGFAQDKGQAVSKGEGGNFRYVQGPNGQIVKQNTDTGEAVPMSVQGVTRNIIKEGEEGPLAREVRERKEAAATAKEEAFRNALLQMAQSQGDGSFTGMGQAKRDRRMAQFLLGQMDTNRQKAAENALEREKMAATERSTEATREQNRLAKAADQALKQKQIDVAQEGNEIRRQALEGKSAKRTYMIGDRPVQMTPEEHREYARGVQKEQYLRKNKDNEDASAQYSRYELARKQVDAALADPKNADKRDAIIAAYEEETGLDYIE